MSTASRGSKARVKRFARRLASPLLNRVDGRVANINWRVEYAWDLIRDQGGLTRQWVDNTHAHIQAGISSLQNAIGGVQNAVNGLHGSVTDVHGSLSTYARSVEESSTYVASELRRLDEAIAAAQEAMASSQEQARQVQEHGLAELYREKLAHARHQTLAELDGDLAWLLNHAAGHRGFAAQADLWFNPPLTVELSRGAAALSSVNERVVEMPFAFGALGRLSPGSAVLDIGSAESTFALSAAALGYRVSAIDLRKLPYGHPNLTSFAGRFEDWKAPRAKFAGAFVISTIEHVGVGGYGETPYGDLTPGAGADRAMIERLAKLLAKDGLLTLTTPFGPAEVNALERVYDQTSLDALLAGWNVLEQRFVIRRDETLWEASDAPQPGERGVVMILATPLRT